jgi:uncharacterized protein YndB with AHSA1/START domain
MSANATELEPLTKVVEVDCDVDHAFRVFTERIAEWWPFESYSIYEGETAACRMEGEAGGELYEVSRSGERAHWATVEAWEPPNRLLLSWQVNPETPAPTAIEVRFQALGPTRTRVELVHRNWELLGPELGAQARAGYADGWGTVLRRYAETAAA